MTQISTISRDGIRKLVREKRNLLSREEQIQAANDLAMKFSQLVKETEKAKIAVYFSNDGELDLTPLINKLRQEGHTLYLPILHPFSGTSLLFQRYEENSPMTPNRYGILEPELNCSHLCPVEQLDIVLTPLVAFDHTGNRLGMGGGFYDRTFARYYREGWETPRLIGIAHECQHVAQLPTEAWDVPLKWIVTPENIYHG